MPKDNLLTDQEIDDILSDIFAGRVDANNLPPAIYYATVDRLIEGMFSGMSAAIADGDLVEPELAQFFRENIGAFSGAKTYQQSRALSAELFDEDGNVRSFAEFKRAAESIMTDFNVHYLDAEFQTAVAVAQSGVQWKQFERDADIFPWLILETVGDDAVRDEHVEMDGLTARVDDPVWEWAMTPNGWRCRCRVRQSDVGPENKVDISRDLVDPTFQFNAGKTGQIFDGSHPYFVIDPADQRAAELNFGFPIDPVGPRND